MIARDVAGEAARARRWPTTTIVSPMFEPKKSRASLPAWPSTVSLPSPGSHWNVSSPPPSSAESAPWLPSTTSSPAPPSRTSAPSAAEQRVVALAAVDRQRGQRREVAGGGDRVVAAEAEDDQALDRVASTRAVAGAIVLTSVPLAVTPIVSAAAVPL